MNTVEKPSIVDCKPVSGGCNGQLIEQWSVSRAFFGALDIELGCNEMSNRVFPFFIALLLLLGIYLGWFLANRPSFSIPALLNVAGIGYSILAVIVLYEAVTEDEKLKRVIVSHVAPFLLWAQTVVPLGVTASWLLTRNLDHGNEISAFGFSFFAYSILPLTFVDATVTFPRIAKLKPLDGRYRRFGLFLLLSGLGMQLIAGLAGL